GEAWVDGGLLRYGVIEDGKGACSRMPDIRRPASTAALILIATYEPLGVVSVRRAAILVLSAKAICVADGDGFLHSARYAMPVPSVIRLTRYVRVPYRAYVVLSRLGVVAWVGSEGGRVVSAGEIYSPCHRCYANVYR